MRRLRTFALGTVGVAAALFALAGPASAHVTVTATGASQGGSDQEITFRVPVEKDLDTVGLALSLPTNTPIASVDVKAMPGWTHTEQTVKLATPIVTDDGTITDAVSEISWTAKPGYALTPGEFGEFTIIAGRLPVTPTLTFGAIQTYSDGSVVKWIQIATPGSAEPDFPAPTLRLAAAAAASPSATVTPAAAKSSSNTGPTVLSVIALVVGAAALGLAVVSRARSGRT